MKLSLIYALSHGIFYFFAICCVGLLFLLNCVYVSEVSYHAGELVSISVSPVVSHIAILALMFFLVMLFFRKRRPPEPAKLFLVLSCLYVAFGVYLIAFSDHTLRSDQDLVFSAALNAIHNDYSALWIGYYMHTHPHQLGLMFYDQQLARLLPYPAFNFALNLVWVLGINFITWQISREIFQEPGVHRLTILLSFAFIPQLFFILFAYGLTPGFFFIILSFHQTLVFARTHRWQNFILLLFCSSVAILLKKNYLIGLVAQMLFLFLQSLKSRNLRMVLLLPIMLLPLLSPNWVTHYYEKKAGLEITNPCPSILYVAMGTDIDNWFRGPGWYDSSATGIYGSLKCDTDAAALAGIEKIRSNLDKIRSRPHDAFVFFRDKTISQWCDPVYQSIWSGPLSVMKQYMHTAFLQDLYDGGVSEDIVAYCCRMLMLLIWGGSLYFLIRSGNRSCGWELAFIYFLGGFLFHVFWEAKSQYVYPYMFVLIPSAAHSIHGLFQGVARRFYHVFPAHLRTPEAD